MNLLKTVIFMTCFLLGISVCATDDTGVDRAVEGARETITSPAKVFEGIEEETEKRGAVGVVTGSVKGGAEAAGQAVKGAADVGIGVIEAIVD